MPGDKFAPIRTALQQMAVGVNEWCGLPVPIRGERLIVESNHPAAKLYPTLGKLEEGMPEGVTLINSFYSHRKRGEVLIWREPDNSLQWGVLPEPHHFKQDVSTMGCSVAWSIEAEENALKLLRSMLPEHLFKMYSLTGMFLETSRRSHVTYMFRRLRPTVALRPEKDGNSMKLLTALCLHPIGYYADTWAGSMCPTDDVIAHLLLMRGDEVMFWRRANQIPPHRAAAGL